MGTPAYMSPEQFRGGLADARSDQFSFCVALYEALFNARPFGGRTLVELADAVVAGRLVDPPESAAVPAWLRTALKRGLSVDPEDRFPSMNDLLNETRSAAGAAKTGFASGAAAHLAETWTLPAKDESALPPEKDDVRRAFLATGKAYAEATFDRTRSLLDRYVERWSNLYVDACEATHLRGEQSTEVLDLRIACLMEGLRDLTALCRLFRAATGEVVENAVSAAMALPPPERCRNIELLRAVVRPPTDAATQEAVTRLRARIGDLRALWRVGRYRDGLEQCAPALEEARRVGYGPTLAEVLLLAGHPAQRRRSRGRRRREPRGGDLERGAGPGRRGRGGGRHAHRLHDGLPAGPVRPGGDLVSPHGDAAAPHGRARRSAGAGTSTTAPP